MTAPKNPNIRRTELVDHGLKLAVEHGYAKVTRKQLAEAAGISEGLVSNLFGTMPQFRRALMRHAVKMRHAGVVGQGLAARDPQAAKADDRLKAAAIRALTA